MQGCIEGQPVDITWRRLIEFQGYAAAFADQVTSCAKCRARIAVTFKLCPMCGLKRDAAKSPEMSQIRYALQRNLTKLRKLSNAQPQGKLQQMQEDINRAHWHTDEEGVYTVDQHKDNQWDPKGFDEATTEVRALLDKTVQITPFYATKIPDSLTDTELEIFSGIVIRPEQVAKIRTEREARFSAESEEAIGWDLDEQKQVRAYVDSLITGEPAERPSFLPPAPQPPAQVKSIAAGQETT